ncbi:MAG: NAD(P)-dependent glycerol-3-phosphate dehydrogenase [Planctomycetes bacterium]|nr:NAD(P)-dependent glycerol-3-phosphate dehydrogenase [Planctomycetota bacterium]
MLSKATVIGAGGMGTVTAQILADNGIHVALLAQFADHAQELAATRENKRYLPGVRLPERVAPTFDGPAALANTELVISAIPCQYLRSVWKELGRYVPAQVPLCSVTKGIEIATLARPSTIIQEYVIGNPVAVLSGPSVAPEVARCLPATVVVAADSLEVATLVQAVLGTSWFRIYTNPDVLGVELAGALKNVIALAAGILDGLHAGDNAKAALLTRGLVEITRLGVALGAHAETFVGLAGVGDLVTTCVSPVGRNRSAGERIGQGVNVTQVVEESTAVIEGIPTTRAVLQLAQQHEVEMPITQAVYQVLFEEKEPLAAITDLMQRPPKAEEPR